MILERKFREGAVIAVRGEYLTCLSSIGPFFMRCDCGRKSSGVHASRQTVEDVDRKTNTEADGGNQKRR
jgi:hypothetical protein